MLRSIGFILSLLLTLQPTAAQEAIRERQYQSSFMRVELAPDQPAFAALAVDSLGKNKLSLSPLRPPEAPGQKYELRRLGWKVEYRPAGAPAGAPAAWAFEFSPRQIRLHSSHSVGYAPPPLVLDFNSNLNHATLLGLMNDDGSVRLPALLHLPDHGTFRITSGVGSKLALGYDALRYITFDDHLNTGGHEEKDYVKVTFRAATAAMPKVDYTLEVVAIYPRVPAIESDSRFDGFRRNWLNSFQLSPHRLLLANNAASDACAVSLYFYSSIAERTPPLAPGLTALDLVRQSLDRYLSGKHGYGLATYENQGNSYPFLDAYPSLLIAAADYVRGSNDDAWLKKNYAGLKSWTARLLVVDSSGNGLLIDPASGNLGARDLPQFSKHASNWWDAIGFGHQDAYSNALAYHALLGMEQMARQAGDPQTAELCVARAEKIRSVYFNTFYNPQTGVMAGWRSTDGQLHDYYFMFVSGAAITYGLVPDDEANQIMDHLLAKMKEVGYTHFEYGLPGNLIPIRRGDYHAAHNTRWGDPEREDGSDTFQVYTNGGATPCMAYFTLQALYQLGRHKEADTILLPMLHAFEEGAFQGRGTNGMTFDWKAWDGTPHGYKGLLADGYQVLLAMLSR